ncbi:Ail/Lom family outer membrane beta-barrel protein [Acerihabitans sp. KWT182]|uniref:Ail/Lom family outer membrane beta-barrel protein n=1 Tax=Acerihabitans sp. KWT182 TaxID=3157919 RepID=A0AAU7QC09_9GAMM
MKKLCLALVTCATLGMNFNALADNNHTVSLGYAQSKIKDGPNLKGVNAKYRFEWDSSISFISSLTYMGKDQEWSYPGALTTNKIKQELSYWSLSAGPAYRFNEFVSLYGLAGINFSKMRNTVTERLGVGGWERSDSESHKSKAFMYGAGVIINPMQNLSLELGYEASSAKFKDSDNKRYSINGFNAGVGYRF